MTNKWFNERKSLKIVLIYALVSSVWIFYSDRALQAFFVSPEAITRLQTLKGWLFVLVTSIIIYWLIEKNYGRYLVMSRAVELLLASNRAFLLSKTAKDICQKLCNILVKEGGYSGAWLGLIDQNNNATLKIMGISGKAEFFLKKEPVSLTGSLGERYPSSVVMSTQKPVVINDVDNINSYPEWRLEAEKNNCCSSVTIPVMEGKKIIGILEIFSAKENSFNDGDLKILNGLANDLAVGLKNFQSLFVKLPIKQING